MNGVDTMIIDKVNDYLNSHSSSTTLLELCFNIKVPHLQMGGK